MTDTNFTEAARAEGQARIAAMLDASGASADIRAWFPAGFEKGAESARDHLAAQQEPTEAEVEPTADLPIIRSAQADALRGAARYFAAGLHCADMRSTPEETVRELNRRADQIEEKD